MTRPLADRIRESGIPDRDLLEVVDNLITFYRTDDCKGVTELVRAYTHHKTTLGVPLKQANEVAEGDMFDWSKVADYLLRNHSIMAAYFIVAMDNDDPIPIGPISEFYVRCIGYGQI